MAVSEEIISAFNEPAREVSARAIIDFTGQFESQSYVYSSIVSNPISRLETLGDGSGGMSCKYAFLDGLWVLGDGFGLAHETHGHIGFISSLVSDENGEFDPAVLLNISLDTPQTISFLTVIADDMRNEYPVDYVVRFYKGAVFLKNCDIQNNADVRPLLEDIDVSECDRIEIAIYRWSCANTPAKISGIAFSPIVVFDRDIINAKIIQTEGSGSSVITGSAASRAAEIIAAEKNGRLSFLSYGELSPYLIQNRRMRLYFGVKIGGIISYTPAGVFYTDNFEVDEMGHTVKISGMDILSLLDDIPFADNMVYPCTLRALAEHIFTQAGMNLHVTYHYFLSSVSLIFPPEWGNISLRRALFYLLEAVFFRAKTMPNGEIELSPIDERSESGVKIDPSNAYSISVSAGEKQMINHVKIRPAAGSVYETKNQNSIEQNGAFLLNIQNNPVIEDYNWAAWLGDKLLAYYCRMRVSAGVVWRGDPRIETGDTFIIENQDGNCRLFAVTSHTTVFDGGIKAFSKGETVD